MQTFGSASNNTLSNFKGLIQGIAVIAIVILIFYIIYSWNNSINKPASDIGSDVGKGIAGAITGLTGGLIEGTGKILDINTKNEGEECSKNESCKGWLAGQPGKLACCNGKCTKMIKDWAGVGYCPDECKDAPAPLGGKCGRGYSWPRKANEPCDTNVACETGLCKSGVCAPNCPNGTNQTVGTCWYDRGAGRIPDKGSCDSGQRDDGTSCWEDLKCETKDNGYWNYTWGGANTKCWDGGYAGWGRNDCYRTWISKLETNCSGCGCIKKNLFQRQSCNSDEELKDGLCYKKPRDGFSCIATVCSRNR